MFQDFADAVADNFEQGKPYRVNVSGESLYDLYLLSFPNGTNPIFRERTEHDCSCCKNFIRQYGNVVFIVNDEIVSIWRCANLPKPYDVVAKKLAKVCEKATIESPFYAEAAKFGTKSNVALEDGNAKTYYHFYGYLSYVGPTKMNEELQNKGLLERTLDLSLNSAETIIELISQGSLYRGEEFKASIQSFIDTKREYESATDKQLWLWKNCTSRVSGVKNSAIGTLLQNLSSGMDLDSAVRQYESIVAPSNYKRPKPLITATMIKRAEEEINALGYADSFHRRYATADDISVENVLFVDRSVKRRVGGGLLSAISPSKPIEFGKVEEVHADKFFGEILPSCRSVEVLVENRLSGNLVTLTAPVNKEAPSLFKWDNSFAWAYRGDIADSMRERVKLAGGKVDGVLRFSIQWNEDGKTESDYDAHCHDPAGGHIFFGNKRSYSGELDVDIICPNGKVAVENITWPSIKNMKSGDYDFSVYCYNKRNGTGGFSAEIEFEGNIYKYNHPSLRQGQTVQVATVNLNNGKFTINNKINSEEASRDLWGIKTGQFAKVGLITISPNHWTKPVGNKHYIFCIDGCKADEKVRGFFNEFLDEQLNKHRRVFEVLGDKMRVADSDEQLSGLGFSTTQNNSVVVRVEGKTKRIMKVVF